MVQAIRRLLGFRFTMSRVYRGCKVQGGCQIHELLLQSFYGAPLFWVQRSRNAALVRCHGFRPISFLYGSICMAPACMPDRQCRKPGPKLMVEIISSDQRGVSSQASLSNYVGISRDPLQGFI